MRCMRISVIALSLALSIAGWAQVPAPTDPGDPQQTAAAPESSARTGSDFAIDLAGYLSLRSLYDDNLAEHRIYRDYAASFFVTAIAGRWRFHSEFNADTAPEYDSDGIHLFPRRPSLSVKLDSASVNYNARDWLQIQAGFLFVPTYWRTHRYQSTTLTVDDPLVDQNVFATAFKGGMIHGDKYFGESGISYQFYGGVDQQTEFVGGTSTTAIERARTIGGKAVLHLPSRRFLQTFDVGVHRAHRGGPGEKPDEIYGLSALLVKDRWEFLGEFDHGSFDVTRGVRAYLRQGYYVQASYRLSRKLFAVSRYETLDRDSRYASQSRLARQLAGLTYRPFPNLSFKLEGDRIEPEAGTQPAYYGATFGVVYFFHRP
jgi:hypothetical protein